MNIDSIRSEEFLLGLLVPIFVVLGVSLLNLYDFIYFLFPPLLIAVFLLTLFWKKWEASAGIVSFVAAAYLIHWFVPIFWAWMMADNEIIRRLLK